jgi:DNA-binding CsgD family transcriptional regulator
MIYTLLVDEHGTVHWISHTDEMHSADQIVGKKLWDLVPADERDQVRDLLAQAVFDDQQEERVFSSRFVNGRPQYRVWMQRAPQVTVVTRVQRMLPPTITAREKEILRLIANDVKPQQIGKRLRLSPNTVDSYRRNLKQKLGVTGTAGLVRWAVRTGLVNL